MWFLYGYEESGKKVVLLRDTQQTGIYLGMCSANMIAHWQKSGIVAWEMKQEWEGRHVSSGR